ncbi:MAG TPA: MarR family transcriptional regulator [Burkholderiaceae bacterium]|mgnify:CR=1 FL=1|nr:MarR family transcriptional regulator [Burkholderiaceae bacterium]
MRSTIGALEAQPSGWKPPLTVSLPQLLVDGSDREFRRFVLNLHRVSTQMVKVRESIAALRGLTAPRYSILMLIASEQGDAGISVRAVAEQMKVSAPFVVTEVGFLIRARLVEKRKNPDDKRGVLLKLSQKGRSELERLAPKLRSVNDSLFGSLSAKDFATLQRLCALLVQNAEVALALLEALARERE